MSNSTAKNFRYPTLDMSPDVPRDMGLLAQDIDDYLTTHPGPQGTQGTQGTQGRQGVQGVQGVQGTTGIQGLIGIQGTQGVQGAQGTQGTQGLLGNQGTQGVQGLQGAQGVQGTQGLLGIQGTQGIQGAQGATGTQGVQGITGASGSSSSYFNYKADANSQTNSQPADGKLRWNNATQTSATSLYVNHLTSDNIDIDLFLAILKQEDKIYVQDANNSDNYQQFKITGTPDIGNNTYVQIPVSYIGAGGIGVTGFPNNHQLVLITFASGVQGTTGLQGVVGSQGVTGLQGIQGTQGVQGAQGTQGSIGSQGVTGLQGFQGTQGVQGIQGILGTQGTYITSATAPVSPLQGLAWLNTEDSRLYVWSGTQWFEPYNNLTGLQGIQGIQGIYGPPTIPQNAQTASYTLALADVGKHVSITTGGVTVPSSTFSSGDNIMIYNNSSSSQTITQGSGVTLRLAGTSSFGNRTLSQYGLTSILCVASNVFVISGSGLS